MAFYNEAWFIHAVNDVVHQLAQQKQSKIMGAVRTKHGVIGKTEPFQRIGAVELVDAVRDSDTTYMNPPQSKRRAVLQDKNGAILLDDFDKVKELADAQSEFSAMLMYARNRQMDRFVLSPTGATVGGALGAATTVDEAAETTGTQTLAAFVNASGANGGSQMIVDGGTGLTLAKLRLAKNILDENEVEEEDRFLFYSAAAMNMGILEDSQATSTDFNSIKALIAGGFPQDQTYMGFKWRMSQRLPKTGNIRQCIAYQKMAVGLAIGLVKDVEVDKAPHKWNNVQAIIKLSAGAVRVDDAAVVSIAVDETA